MTTKLTSADIAHEMARLALEDKRGMLPSHVATEEVLAEIRRRFPDATEAQITRAAEKFRDAAAKAAAAQSEAADDWSEDDMPTISKEKLKAIAIVHIGESGRVVDFLHHGDLCFIVIDERAPHDRVYELTKRNSIEEIAAVLGDEPIGSCNDVRHPGVAARILDHLGRVPRLSVVKTDPTESNEGEPPN